MRFSRNIVLLLAAASNQTTNNNTIVVVISTNYELTTIIISITLETGLTAAAVGFCCSRRGKNAEFWRSLVVVAHRTTHNTILN